MGKTFQELNLSNAFLFAATLEDEKTCQLVLEIILGHQISKVKVHTEHSILINSDFKSVRLDVYASDELRVNYDLEAQNDNENNLAKRSRFYQAELDVTSLKPGEDYHDLRPSYIIFICTFDPFGEGIYRYTFEERCLERNIGLGDGTKKIFLNTKGRNGKDVPKELVHFLKYMEKSTDDTVKEMKDPSIAYLHERVTNLKKRGKLEARYMTLEEWAKIRERKAARRAKAEFLLEILEDSFVVPEDLRERILSETDSDTLRKWYRLAFSAESIEQFQKEI